MPTASRRMNGVSGTVTTLQLATGAEYYNDFSVAGVVASVHETQSMDAMRPGTRLRVSDGTSGRLPKRNTGRRTLRFETWIDVHVKRADSDALDVEMRQVIHDIELVIDKNLVSAGVCSEVINILVSKPVYDFAQYVATTDIRVIVEADIVEGSTT